VERKVGRRRVGSTIVRGRGGREEKYHRKRKRRKGGEGDIRE